MTITLRPDVDTDAVARCAQMLLRGELVAFPTETVYGLGANALNAQAVRAVFAAKGRPADDPLIVHVAVHGPGTLDALGAAGVVDVSAVDDTTRARFGRLVERFWPGPLTIVVPRGPAIDPVVTAGLPMVGVRCPAHPPATALIAAAGVPVAAPSANRFGRVSPTTAAAVIAELGGRIAAVLDGGPCAVGVESTVIALEPAGLRPLRSGAVGFAEAAAVAEAPLLEPPPAPQGAAPAPGMLASHYAPDAMVRLWNGEGAVLAASPRPFAVLAAGPAGGRTADAAGAADVRVLAPDGDARTAARALYAALRELDAGRPALIWAELWPGDDALSAAIRDRQRRAAAPRAP